MKKAVAASSSVEELKESGRGEPRGPEDTEDPEGALGSFLWWAGRRQSSVAVPKPRILEEVPEYSDPSDDDPGNLVIEGDNRQAMISLLPQYVGKVDVVLIDPPYNTGKRDFRYNDSRFEDPDADVTRGDFVAAEDGGKHTKWLNQMAPTLRIIRDLMAPHAVMFVHIDDRELPRLLLLLEEIFDEGNRIGMVVWRNASDNNPSQIAIEHEYIVCWAKDKEAVPKPWRGQVSAATTLAADTFERLKSETRNLTELRAAWRRWLRENKKELPPSLWKKVAVDGKGPYQPDGNLANPGKQGYFFDVLHPVTKIPVKVPARGWRFAPDGMERLIEADMIEFGADETKVPGLRYRLDAGNPERLRSVVDLDNRAAFYEMLKLFPENPAIFKNPKPVAIEDHLLSFVADREALILDAFAGSGTTGHAVMRVNSRDGGSRRYILIEEGTEGDEYAATLTAERLRRARGIEALPGGFRFMRVGARIDLDGFAQLARKQLVEMILQTDASGRDGRIKPIAGAKYVIGSNSRGEAICLHHDADTRGPVSSEILREMYVEAKALGLAKPLRVYAERSEVFGSDSFRFFKIPDEVANNLVMTLRGTT